MKEKYIEVSQENGKEFIQRNIIGSFTMLNLLKFKTIADYSGYDKLKPETAMSGELAYNRYIELALPLLQENGSELLYKGKGGQFTIGPSDESWDLVLLVKHKSVQDFLSFAQNKSYLEIVGHRNASLEDSRLLALED